MLRRLFGIWTFLGLSLLSVAQVSVAQAAGVQAAPTTATASAASVPTLPLRVLQRYPHATDAFTEGLVLDGAALLESTGLDGDSSLRRVALKSGVVSQKVRPPDESVFAEGTTTLGKVAYQLTWKDGIVYLYDSVTLRSIGQLGYTGEGWGLTNDGKQLIMSDGGASLTWRDPRTFAVRKTLKVTAGGQPVTNINELEYVPSADGKGGAIYANIWLTNQVARIDPQTGKVTAWLDMSPLAREAALLAQKRGGTLGFDDVANGIAYNPLRGTLLLTGKRWPVLYEVAVGR